MKINYNITLLDADFDKTYLKRYQELSKIHWTPVEIIKLSVQWLTHGANTKILDIGSGVGKFCIVGALISNAKFTGVEIRKTLVDEAQKVKKKLKTDNVNFLNEDITGIDFNDYNSFYYFNPFCEQIATADWIDKTLKFSEIKFNQYKEHVRKQLKNALIGTRIVIYCSDNDVIPEGYSLSNIGYEGQLQLWIKKH
tara:strand:- start:2130 stop:2717 length:588 start_codon:yes stop_codon:yes gene_type:complete